MESYTYVIRRCDECRRPESEDNVLVRKSACADYHSSGIFCCKKYVCENGCLYRCIFCNEINRVIIPTNGYIDEYKCYLCDQPNTEFGRYWFGISIHENCRRYCGQQCLPDKISVYGRPNND